MLLDFVSVMNKFADELSDEQFKNLLRGKGRVVYIEDEAVENINETVDNRLYDYAMNINKLNSREAAFTYIEELKLKKEELIEIGKLVNANVFKKDNKQRIIERIVEASVGTRLRSEAIKEIDLNRKI